jgi:hypothetical protein
MKTTRAASAIDNPMKSGRELQRYVRRLLGRHGINSPPVPVDRLAADVGVVLRKDPFDGSGNLGFRGFYVSDESAVKNPLIWVNTAYSPAIQRWTIARELAHHLLRCGDIHIDLPENKDRPRKGTARNLAPEERRAQQFAAELLMPRHMLTSDLKTKPILSEDDEALRSLASRYQVSIHALVTRLQQLELATPLF